MNTRPGCPAFVQQGTETTWLQWLAALLLCWSLLSPALADERLRLPADHVAEADCLGCHQAQAAQHADSHHARAMLPASADSVRARFPSTYAGPGPQAQFLREGERFLVDIDGPQGERGRFVIAYTFGFEPLQQYLVELPGGRLQALDLAWDTAAGRWFWLGEGEEAPAADAPLHWSGSFYRWNRNCADCHSTALRKGFELDSKTYQTTYAHVSIGCQSCHGGGAGHVRWAEQQSSAGKAGDKSKDSSRDSGRADNKGWAAAASAESCLGCHARRVVIADGFGPGADFLDHHSPSLIENGLYFADGQIRDEVFEYGSFLQSRMASAGVNCVDCHEPHSGRIRHQGEGAQGSNGSNGLCLSCHGVGAQSRFGQLAPQADFAAPAHTGHAAGTPGAACVDCHMPSRLYMKVDARRDHRFGIPRPDLGQTHGLPDACSGCHQDRNAAWAAQTMDDWYGKGWRARAHTATALTRAWSGHRQAGQSLRELIANTELSAILRASALLAYAQVSGEGAAPLLREAATSADALLRLGAAQGLGELPPALRAETAGGLLGDARRAVRLAALRALAAVPQDQLDAQQLKRAEEDLQAYLLANIDTAEAHALLGNVRFDQQRWAEAEAAFRQAIRLDRHHADAYLDLAELKRLRGDEAAAVELLDAGLQARPDRAELHHARGLAHVRGGRLDAAVTDLRAAWRLAPASNEYAYTYALALDAAGQPAAALAALRDAPLLRRDDVRLLGVQLQLALKLDDVPAAARHARALLRLEPDNVQLRGLLQQLQGRK